MRITTYALHNIHWKHLQIAIVLLILEIRPLFLRKTNGNAACSRARWTFSSSSSLMQVAHRHILLLFHNCNVIWFEIFSHFLTLLGFHCVIELQHKTFYMFPQLAILASAHSNAAPVPGGDRRYLKPKDFDKMLRLMFATGMDARCFFSFSFFLSWKTYHPWESFPL